MTKYKKGMHPNSRNGFKKGCKKSATAHSFQKGNHPKTEIKKGDKLKQETKDKIGLANSNKGNGMWKGDNAGKIAMHIWISNKKGKAKEHKCIDCDKQAEEWSNINNHIYRRELDDYVPRCRKCHKKYDRDKI